MKCIIAHGMIFALQHRHNDKKLTNEEFQSSIRKKYGKLLMCFPLTSPAFPSQSTNTKELIN
jgi:hypothetical protein